MKLSMEEKIGQRFIFGINGSNIQSIINLVRNNHIGGVVLYKKNYRSFDDMISVINRLKEANRGNKIPLFIAIDQEGGRVNRMPSEIHNMKNISDISRGGIELVGESAICMSKMLHSIGVNMNLAPVIDINNNNKSKVLDKRCFYDKHSEYGSLYVKNTSLNGVIPVIKHYPGHGASLVDSHRIVPYVFNYREVLDKHMKPFRDVMANGCDALMIGHLAIRGLTGGMPASISNNFIQKYIRDTGYDGLIMTDEINMLGYNLIYRFTYLKKALKSLNDIILIKIKSEEEALAIIDKYKKILDDNEYVSNLDNSVERILKIKEKYKINDNVISNVSVEEINGWVDEINQKVTNFTKSKK